MNGGLKLFICVGPVELYDTAWRDRRHRRGRLGDWHRRSEQDEDIDDVGEQIITKSRARRAAAAPAIDSFTTRE